MTLGNAKSRLSGLEEYFTRFKANHNRILSLTDLDKDHDYFKSILGDIVEDSYFDRKGEFNDYIESLRLVQEPQTSTQTPNLKGPLTPPSVTFQSLPKMELPKFSGKFADWENFRDIFRSIIHRREDMAPVVKFYFLRTHLMGDALEKIKSYQLSDDNYARA